MTLNKWIPKFLKGEAVALDEAGNVAILDGNPHETISAHCGAQFEAKKPCRFCRLTCGFIQDALGKIWPKLKTHCADSWRDEKPMVIASIKAAGVNPADPGGPV